NKDQLVAYLRGEIANPQGAAAGPMLPVSLSLAELPVADVEAIATYVLDLKGEHLNAAGPECSAVTTATSASGAGAALFAGACAQCHGEGAPMRTQGARPGLVATSALTSDSSQNLIQTILQGIPLSTRASSHYMPAFADTLTDAHISALATYLRSVSCPARPWTDLDTTIATIRREGASK
ncbi:MAG: cytochrome, partial [Pseudomonas sp.]|nr:cytochrome [Pseudomonas sp.]